jgi:hypothetical protein
MSRPPVTVVVPFGGDPAEGLAAVALLRRLSVRPDDRLVLADNSGNAPVADDVEVVRARGESSPAHARNAGAVRATTEWILFLDADVRAPADLLDLYFAAPVAADVGALAGEIEGAVAPGAGVVARYGAARNFLSQRAHLAHPFRPRAAAANLLVRRRAFEAVGGFREGVRTAEDTDLAWRLQGAGWRLELRPQAVVLHEYRATVGELRRQWRAYAAGRAWLAREYPGFQPEPAVARVLRRALGRGPARRALGPPNPRRPLSASAAPAGGTELSALAATAPGSRFDRAAFLALDALLAVEELIGLRMANRPADRR